ncbi:MAG: MFS transporter [Ruminiclostridium sp.]|nr:MFS transporter [Ruminiclostridium sp.]
MAILYLLGLFIGAIDTGIITPARPLIQNQLGVDANLGIWMITIYTLTYAAIIPIFGKLADMRGRKPVYLLSIALFGAGSVICAVSALTNSFFVLMIGRIVQASGAGGIMPVATAEFGTSFPEEKRGMALGLVGAVYGIANVLGASAGSLILDIAGADQWQWIFLVNVPICLFIVVAGIVVLPNNRAEDTKAMDKLGTLLMTIIILALLYGLKNLDFFDFVNSFTSTQVWPFIGLSVVLIPVFAIVERRAEDPIFHIEYVSNRQIMVTLALGVLVGCSMMGMIFIPQFAENALKMASGSGGYFVIILGFCAGGASMMSGNLIDKHGAKPVMAAGFLVTIVGCLYLSLVAVRYINVVNVIISLVLIGFGLGLTMGTPLNYMMLQNTSDEESNSALATLSLVRSIGTAVAPAIMVGFIVHSAGGLQDNLMDILPKEAQMPELPYAQEIDSTMERYKNDPDFSEQMDGVEIPKLTEMTTMEINMGGDGDSDYEMPADLLEKLQNSDVTTITDSTVELVKRMSDDMYPDIIAEIQGGIDEGIQGVQTGIGGMKDALSEMQEGYDGISQGIQGMSTGINAQQTALNQLKQARSMLAGFKNGFPAGMGMLDFIPADVKNGMPQSTLDQLAQVKSSADLRDMITKLDSTAASMQSAVAQIDGAIAIMAQFPDGKVPEGQTLLDFIPEEAQANMPAQVLQMLGQITDVSQLTAQKDQMESAIAAQTQASTQLNQSLTMMTELENGKLPTGMTLLDFIPASALKSIPQDTLGQLKTVRSVSDLSAMINKLESSKSTLTKELADAKASQKEMGDAMAEIRASMDEMETLSGQLITVKDAIPGAFDEAGTNYASAVEGLGPEIEDVFQATMNVGYRDMYLFQVGANALGLVLLLFYREPKRLREE